jgi:hypothetical protein
MTDVIGYYADLEVELPEWGGENRQRRCFANPAAHHHADSHPSCSVNVASGAWKCHACGEQGGAYDAAWFSASNRRRRWNSSSAMA